jgi:hypothetical protein
VFADTIRVNSALVTASTVPNTDSDNTHMFRLRATGQVWLDLFLKN